MGVSLLATVWVSRPTRGLCVESAAARGARQRFRCHFVDDSVKETVLSPHASVGMETFLPGSNRQNSGSSTRYFSGGKFSNHYYHWQWVSRCGNRTGFPAHPRLRGQCAAERGVRQRSSVTSWTECERSSLSLLRLSR